MDNWRSLHVHREHSRVGVAGAIDHRVSEMIGTDEGRWRRQYDRVLRTRLYACIAEIKAGKARNPEVRSNIVRKDPDDGRHSCCHGIHVVDRINALRLCGR